MSSGADLFVVCKQCGAEVSPYITECPYCGHRLRKRAPKLPRERVARGASGVLAKRGGLRLKRPPAPSLGRLRRGEIPGLAGERRPYATIAIVGVSVALWVLWQGGVGGVGHLALVGPLGGSWWRLLSSQLVYPGGTSGFLYGALALGTVAMAGAALEERHGAPVVLALFLGVGVVGCLVTLALYAHGASSGANAGALALLGAWSAPALLAAAGRSHHDHDLLAAAAVGLALLAMPFALPQTVWVAGGGLRSPASWVAGLAGAALGTLLGVGLARARPGAG